MTAVAVVGMHRSGTSLFASWLHQCGIDMSQSPMAEGADNPHGFFEDPRFVQLHSRAIRHTYGPASKGWIVTSAVPLAFRTHERTLARLLVWRRSQLASWGWKDPRSTFFLQEWCAIVPDLVVIALWRRKEEVVSSLLRRTGEANDLTAISAEHASAAWDAYNTAICNWSTATRQPHVVISLDRLRDGHKPTLRAITKLIPRSDPSVFADVFDSGSLMTMTSPKQNALEQRLVQLSA